MTRATTGQATPGTAIATRDRWLQMYDHEYDEWREAVADMSETERAATEYDVRRSAGLSGDRGDVEYE